MGIFLWGLILTAASRENERERGRGELREREREKKRKPEHRPSSSPKSMLKAPVPGQGYVTAVYHEHGIIFWTFGGKKSQ